MNNAKIDAIKEFFTKDRFATDMGAQIDWVKDGCAECSLMITDGHKNAGGAVQGGAIFTLADFAFAVAANSLGKMTVSVNNSISFISASKGKKLIAKATRLSNSKRLCFYNVSVTDDKGALIADMSVTGYIKDIEMPF